MRARGVLRLARPPRDLGSGGALGKLPTKEGLPMGLPSVSTLRAGVGVASSPRDAAPRGRVAARLGALLAGGALSCAPPGPPATVASPLALAGDPGDAPAGAAAALAADPPIGTPACTAAAGAIACMNAALDAMGGRDRLAALRTARLDRVVHTALVEQSYRQAPFITAYSRDRVTLDLAGKRLAVEAHATWPEADPGTADTDATLVASLDAAAYRKGTGDTPGGRADIEGARHQLELGPLSLLLTAAAAPDLHLETPERIRANLDDVLGFTWRGVHARLALSPLTHLPDALETVETFSDFWFYMGDVRRRVYFDNWRLVGGVRFPSNEVEERNGVPWQSRQALSVELDVPVADAALPISAAASAKSAASRGFDRPFDAGTPREIAPGVELYAGSWNASVIVQKDGLIVLEAPLSGRYVAGLLDAVTARHPGLPIRAVLSTSDSWPHVGGVRECVARGLPIYVLDANLPLLHRMIDAPHTLAPDSLARAPRPPDLRAISAGEAFGRGDEAVRVYPLRGASTERQYMVYLPGRKLLYASDTLVLNDDGSLYDPELMFEVAQAVAREKLEVEQVYAMHQEPIPWAKAAALVRASSVPAVAAPTAAATLPAATAALGDLATLAGRWSCSGHFSSGAAIASDVRFDVDLAGQVLVKHHDDTTPPALYHAIEVWAPQPSRHRILATITDVTGGVRQFASPGRSPDRKLTFTSEPGVSPRQRFVYTPADDGTLRIDWLVASQSPGDVWKMGDTLTCQRAG